MAQAEHIPLHLGLMVSVVKKTLGLPVVFWDERLTTRQALRILHQQKMNGRKKKKLKDQVAATIILSNYLESERENFHVSEDH